MQKGADPQLVRAVEEAVKGIRSRQ